MHKLNIPRDTSFTELPLATFDELKFSLYILDHGWNYLFVNEYVKQNLAGRGTQLVGRNMWTEFKELANDPAFMRLKADTEKGIAVNMITTSPINGQRLNVVGYPLKDCYFFYASQLPKKEELLTELRSALRNSSPDQG